jgi:RNA polymerase sigma-70 factor, ECF subfamily
VPTEIERLYREHRAGLVRLVERELHDHHEAEDVVQTAFLDAQRALERGTIPRNPRAWLAAIALNAGRRLRRRRVNADPLEDYAVQEASRMPEIRAALTGLPKEQRTAVLYRDVVGLSYDETAEQMGTSVNAVTMLLYRGRQRLREALGVTSGGAGWWRWLKQGGATQLAVAKGAAAVVVAAGLATGGVVAAGRAAREAAPVTTEAVAAAPAAESGSLAAVARRTPRALTHGSTRPHIKENSVVASARSVGVAGVTTKGSVPAPTTALSTSTARVTTNLLTLSSVTLPAVAATATVATPVATVTAATPTVTAATVTTPVTTVTLPIP